MGMTGNENIGFYLLYFFARFGIITTGVAADMCDENFKALSFQFKIQGVFNTYFLAINIAIYGIEGFEFFSDHHIIQ